MVRSTARVAIGVVLVAGAVAACGGAAAAPRGAAQRPRVDVRAAACPVPAPSRSSAGAPDVLAGGHPLATRFCVYRTRRTVDFQRVYPGGPLDRALDGSTARFPPRTACGAVATLRTVVVLTYPGGPARHVVVDVGGCALVTSRGSTRVLTDRALDAVSADYESR